MRRWLLLLGLCSTACAGAATSTSPTATPSAAASTPIPATSRAAVDPVFNQSLLHDVRLELDPADWQALRDNFLTNQYYAADITIDGETVHQIGIRSRGSGSRNDVKPALKLDFNKYVGTQRFHGYHTMHLINMFQDPSLMRERLAFS